MVEYLDNGCVVRVSSQIQVEKVIMAENSKYFVLAYSSPLLCRDVIENIGMLGEKEASQLLLTKGIIIPDTSPVLSDFLQLLH